jgi:ABC-type branched-subunit amino acid transport system substrate-binding protein
MHTRRLVRVAAVFAGLSFIMAACGDDSGTSSSTTTAGGDTSTTAASGGSGGELEGMKGTTPAPVLTDAVTAFRARMDEVDPNLGGTYAYGPESYDSVIIVALAAAAAGDDGSALAGEIVNVTKDGEQCSTYADCLALIQAGTDIDYEGASGPTDMSGNGEPLVGTYDILEFGPDNRVLDNPENRSAEASQEFKDMPNDPVEVDRAGDGVLTIGTLLPETGNLAFLGPPEIAGVNVAIAEINEAGGFNGQDVVLVTGDSGDTTTDTATQTVTRELSQNVDAIIGAASSSVSASVIDQITGAGVVQFSPANTSKQFSDYPDKGLYFRLGPSDILQGQVLAEVIADDGHQNIVILNFDDDYGNGLADDLTSSFEESGGTVVDRITYDPQAQTFDSEVAQAKAADADALVLIGFEETSRLLAALVEQGIGPRDIPTYGVDGNMGNALGEDFDSGS